MIPCPLLSFGPTYLPKTNAPLILPSIDQRLGRDRGYLDVYIYIYIWPRAVCHHKHKYQSERRKTWRGSKTWREHGGTMGVTWRRRDRRTTGRTDRRTITKFQIQHWDQHYSFEVFRLLNMDMRRSRPYYEYKSSLWTPAEVIVLIVIVLRARNCNHNYNRCGARQKL